MIFILSFIPRLIYLFLEGGKPLRPSSNLYWDLSTSLLQHGTLGLDGVPKTADEWLYPLFLAVGRWVTRDNFFLVMFLQIAAASLGAVYFHKLSLFLSGDARTAGIGAFLYSFYPYLVHQSVRVTEVGFLAPLLIASAYYFSKSAGLKDSLQGGIAWGLSILARAAVLPIWLLGVAALVLKRRFAPALVTGVTTLLLILPLFLRNYRLSGSLVPSRSGFNLLKGNCDYSDRLLPAHSLDLLNPYVFGLLEKEIPDPSKRSEREVNEFFTQRALQFMKENPVRTLKLKLRNVLYFFDPRLVPFYPVREDSKLKFTEGGRFETENIPRRKPVEEWAHSLSYSFILLTALYGLWLRRGEFQRDLILYLIPLSFVAVSSLYWPATRLRAPTDFVLMFYSACAVSRWLPKA